MSNGGALLYTKPSGGRHNRPVCVFNHSLRAAAPPPDRRMRACAPKNQFESAVKHRRCGNLPLTLNPAAAASASSLPFTWHSPTPLPPPVRGRAQRSRSRLPFPLRHPPVCH